MLTGVYVLDKAERLQAREFYKSSLKKLGIPFLIFVIVYFFYDIYVTRTKTIRIIFSGIITGFSGMYAHWYMVMLSVVYAFIPLLAFIRRNVSWNSWRNGTITFFVWVMLGHFFESSVVTWSLSNMYLLGYVLLGNMLHQLFNKIKKSNFKGTLLIVIGLLILFLNGIILDKIVCLGGDYYNKLVTLYSAPLVIVGSVVIFSGFSLLSIKFKLKSLAEISYIVFLSHKILIDVISKRIFSILEQKFCYNILNLILIEYIIVLPLVLVGGFLMFRLINKIRLCRRR